MRQTLCNKKDIVVGAIAVLKPEAKADGYHLLRLKSSTLASFELRGAVLYLLSHLVSIAITLQAGVLAAQELVEVQSNSLQFNNAAPQVNSVNTAPSRQIFVQNLEVGEPAYVQQLPTTRVEAAPLDESRASQLRKVREQAEIQTEQKIVEKLEASRLEDERIRAQRLFGDKYDQPVANAASASQQPTVHHVVHPAPAVVQPVQPVVQPQPVIHIIPVETLSTTGQHDHKSEPVTHNKEQIKSEIAGEIISELAAEKIVDGNLRNDYYVGANAGLINYPGVVNVEGQSSFGFVVGGLVRNRFSLEGGFQYAQLQIEDLYWSSAYFPLFRQLDQYNFSAGAKYALFTGMLRPIVGLNLSYTYREYQDGNAGQFRTQLNQNYQNTTTTAFDIGALVGLDVVFAQDFSVGLHYQYFTNLSNEVTDGVNYSQFRGFGSPIEELDYELISVVGKIYF